MSVINAMPLGNEVLGQTTSSSTAAPGNKFPGRVVVNYNKSAVGTSGASSDVIKNMTDDSIMLLTGNNTVAEAWKAIFPSTLTAKSKIAIHDPCGYTAVVTAAHPAIFEAVIQGLLSMDLNGEKLPAANITIYDANNRYSMESRGITAAIAHGATVKQDSCSNQGDGANGKPYVSSLKNADFLINIFRLSGHSGGGFSLGYKAHYGTYPPVHNESDLTAFTTKGPVYEKEVFSICSAIYGIYESSNHEGGPQDFTKYAKAMDATSTGNNPTTIVMGTDAQSVEMQSIKIIRTAMNKSYALNDLPGYLRNSTACGVIDETKMDVRKLLNERYKPTGTILQNPVEAAKRAPLTAHHLPDQNHTFIEYMLPAWLVGKEATIEIADMKGALVRMLSSKVLGRLTHLSWDERNSAGMSVTKGTYAIRLTLGTEHLSTTVSVM